MSILLRKSVLIPLTQFVSALITGAMELLIGETQGYAIDATSINNRSYIGGPDGGEVACRDTSTPANDLSNVPLDSSNLTQSGTSPKIVNWNTFSGPHNLLTYSEYLTSADWGAQGGTVTVNNTASPDGRTTAELFTLSAGSAVHNIFVDTNDVKTITNAVYTVSGYVKFGTASFIMIGMGAASGTPTDQWGTVVINSSGTITETTNGAAFTLSGSAVESVGSGWFRVSISGSWAEARGGLNFQIVNSGTPTHGSYGNVTWSAVGTETAYFWGAQVNFGFLTAYVPTTAVCSGGVRWTPHNSLLQSQTIDNASWTKTNSSITANATTSPDNTLTADKLVENGTAGVFHLAVQSATVVVGFAYTFSVYAKAAERTLIILNHDDGTDHLTTFDLANGVLGTNNDGNDASIAAVGNGWYRCSITNSPTATTLSNVIFLAAVDDTIAYNGNGTSGAYIWGAQLNRGPVATPYLVTTAATRVGIPQGYDVANSKFGMLIEPAATNLLQQSQTFDNITWDPEDGSVSADAAVSPDGTTTADQYTTGAGAIHQSLSISSGSTYTYSVFIKGGTATWVRLTFSDAGANEADAWFNVATGTAGGVSSLGTSVSVGRAILVAVGGGWYRASYACTPNITSSIPDITCVTADLGSTRDNGKTILLWGAQIELGSVATSYVPTAAATATRAQDDISTSATIPAYSSELTFWFWFREFVFSATNGEWVTNSISAQIYDHTSSGNYRAFANAVADANIGAQTLTQSKIAARFKTNDYRGALNGTLGTADVAGALPADTGSIDIGPNANGFVYQLIYVPRGYTDTELQSKTGS